MSAPSASNGAMTPSARAEPDTRLHGRWLLLARVVWVGVVALIVADIAILEYLGLRRLGSAT